MRGHFLGRSGLAVSRLCLGTMTFGWTADEATSFEIMDAAADAGITFFDTANMYSRWVDGNEGGESERIIGKWLAKRGDRHKFVIATKVRARMWEGTNGEGLSRAHIVAAVEDSLRRLQTDYIDLYQAHWYDDITPIEETLLAFDALVRSGKVRYIGASNHPAWRLTKALWRSDVRNTVRYISLQPHYNLLHRSEFETELRDLCIDQQLGVIPYSPLAAGFLTGKYSQQPDEVVDTGFENRVVHLRYNERAYKVLEAVREVAEQQEATPAQIALAWLLSKRAVTSPIVGARTADHIIEAAGAMRLRLNSDQIKRLDDVSSGF
jgi:aryl-alcohol dehydrogenase-like predicted oxidoreductase